MQKEDENNWTHQGGEDNETQMNHNKLITVGKCKLRQNKKGTEPSK